MDSQAIVDRSQLLSDDRQRSWQTPRYARVGIWFEDAFYFSTGPRSRKAKNIMKNTNCVVCPENAKDAVVLEGTVRKTRPDGLTRRVVERYEQKYKWKMEGTEDSFYQIHPKTVFGFVENGSSNPTRWSFCSKSR